MAVVSARLASIALAASCSFQHGALPGDDDPVPAGDATTTTEDSRDADDATTCMLGDWSAPQPIAELDTGTYLDSRPRFSPDERTVYFYSMRPGGAGDRDLYTATRASVSQPFSTPLNLAELNTAQIDRDPAITPDGLQIFFSSNRPSGEYEIWTATRATTADPFSAPQLTTLGMASIVEYFVAISHDGLRLYFSATHPGTLGGFDIWYSTRTSTAVAFGAPQNFAAANSTFNDYAVAISADELEVYFSSTRGGSIQIYRMTRATTTSAWSTPAVVPAVSVGSESHPSWLSLDGRRFYFSHQASGVSQIYVATRTCQ